MSAKRLKMYEHITILEQSNQVIKHTKPEIAALEFSLAQSAIRLTKNGNFNTPAILSADLERGIIVYEYINGIKPLFDFRDDSELFTSLVKRAADALVYIHHELKTDSCIPIEFPKIDEGVPVPRAFLHGDFNLENVQYDEKNDRIFILDWSLTPLLKEKRGNYGAVFWDACWFIRSIFFTPPYLFNYNSRRDAAIAFLKSYFKINSNGQLPESFAAFMALCYDFSTWSLNPKISWHLYVRQSVCRHYFKKFSEESENTLTEWA
jgi:hypothetical protein